MPELPEVESARKCVELSCIGALIERIITEEQGGGPRNGLVDDKVILNKHQEFEGNLTGKTISGVKRRGKYLWIEIESCSSAILFHFGMTGCLLVEGQNVPTYRSFVVSEEWPPKFSKIEIRLSTGKSLVFCDPRRLGRVQLIADPLRSQPVSKLASDPFLDSLSLPEFRSRLSAYTSDVKSIFLDQEKIYCGLGNWLCDEIFYQSKIHPASKSDAIASDEGLSAQLQNSVHNVVRFAVEVNADYKRFPENWLFHYRWGKKIKKLPNGKLYT